MNIRNFAKLAIGITILHMFFIQVPKTFEGWFGDSLGNISDIKPLKSVTSSDGQDSNSPSEEIQLSIEQAKMKIEDSTK